MKLIFWAILFFLCTLESISQTLYSSEKIFIHTDKDFYFENDTLWASLYLFDASTHYFSDSSLIVYVNLINSNGEILKSLTLKLLNGRAKFNFELPENKKASEIRLIAYTKYMLNQDECFHFQKKIYLFSDLNLQETPILSSQIPQLKFYPEGGELVNGILSKIGFQCFLESGKGFNIKGKIVDQYNIEIADFQSAHVGIGFFYLKPESKKEYYAVFEHDGLEVKTKLPNVKQQGYTLAVTVLQNNLNGFLIEVKGNIPTNNALSLLIHQRGNILLNTTFKDKKSVHKFLFKLSEKIKYGIVHATLFDENLQPLAERLFFNSLNPVLLDLKISPITKKYLPFQKIEFSFEFMKNQKAIEDTLSLSVSIVDANQDNLDPNIAFLNTYLHLNSDLKGIIESPNSYFDLPATKAKFFLDNLMLTHGWRRFVWNAKANSTHTPEKNLKLSGMAFKNNVIQKNKTIFLNIWSDAGFQTKIVLTDEKGKYEVFGNWFGNILILGLDNKGKELVLVQDKNPPKLPNTVFFEGNKQFLFDEFVTYNKLKRSEKNEFELSELVVKAKKTDPLRIDSRRTMYGGDPDLSLEISPEMTSGALDLVQLLEGRLVGIKPGLIEEMASTSVPSPPVGPSQAPSGNLGPPPAGSSGVAQSFGSAGSGWANAGGGLLILVDGVRVPGSFIRSIPVNMVDRVDLLREISKTSIYGLEAGAGKVINILTKTHFNAGPTISSKNIIKNIGISGPFREFYSPHNITSAENSGKYRSTLLWCPNIKFEPTKMQKLSFYNNGTSTKFIVRVEATDGKGGFGSFQYILK